MTTHINYERERRRPPEMTIEQIMRALSFWLEAAHWEEQGDEIKARRARAKARRVAAAAGLDSTQTRS